MSAMGVTGNPPEFASHSFENSHPDSQPNLSRMPISQVPISSRRSTQPLCRTRHSLAIGGLARLRVPGR